MIFSEISTSAALKSKKLYSLILSIFRRFFTEGFVHMKFTYILFLKKKINLALSSVQISVTVRCYEMKMYAN